MTPKDREADDHCDAFLRTTANVESVSLLDRSPSTRNAIALSETHAASTRKGRIAYDSELLHQLESLSHFWVLAIKIDTAAAQGSQDALQHCVDQILQLAIPEQDRIKTRWDSNICLCAVRDRDQAAVSELARHVQARLAEQHEATITIGIAAFPLGQYNRSDCTLNAYKALDHAAFFGPGAITFFDAVSCNISGDNHYQAGEQALAMEEYRAGLALDPSNANLLNSLGVCLANSEELHQAKAAFDGALQHDPKEAFALYNLGMIEIMDDHPQKALAPLKKAFALNQHTFEIPFQIGKILCDQARYSDALPYFEAASAICTGKGAAFRLMGQCLAAIGNHDKAIASYRRAVKLNPNDAQTLSALGTLYATIEENPDVCMAFFNQSIAIEPHNGLFQHRLGNFYHDQNQLQKALQAYEKAIDLGHDSSSQLLELQNRMGDATPDRNRRSA